MVIHFIPRLNQLLFDGAADVETCVAVLEVALNAAANLALIFPFTVAAIQRASSFGDLTGDNSLQIFVLKPDLRHPVHAS